MHDIKLARFFLTRHGSWCENPRSFYLATNQVNKKARELTLAWEGTDVCFLRIIPATLLFDRTLIESTKNSLKDWSTKGVYQQILSCNNTNCFLILQYCCAGVISIRGLFLNNEERICIPALQVLFYRRFSPLNSSNLLLKSIHFPTNHFNS